MDTPSGDAPSMQPDADAAPGTETPQSAHAGVAPGSWPRRYQSLWVAAILLIVVAFVWVRLSVGGPRVTQIVTDVVVTIGATTAAIGLTFIGWRKTDQPTQGWRLLAVGNSARSLSTDDTQTGEVTGTPSLSDTGPQSNVDPGAETA